MRTTAGIVLESGESRSRPGARDDDLADALAIVDGRDVGPSMFVALTSADRALGGARRLAASPGRPHFTPSELAIADDLAGRVGLAIELAKAREDRQRALLIEDRARIARDLHDHVIQQLFGAGLALQAVAGEVGDGDASRRLESAIATLDESIAQIRTIIFALRPHDDAAGSVRASDPRDRDPVLGLAAAGPSRVAFSGPRRPPRHAAPSPTT